MGLLFKHSIVFFTTIDLVLRNPNRAVVFNIREFIYKASIHCPRLNCLTYMAVKAQP